MFNHLLRRRLLRRRLPLLLLRRHLRVLRLPLLLLRGWLPLLLRWRGTLRLLPLLLLRRAVEVGLRKALTWVGSAVWLLLGRWPAVLLLGRRCAVLLLLRRRGTVLLLERWLLRSMLRRDRVGHRLAVFVQPAWLADPFAPHLLHRQVEDDDNLAVLDDVADELLQTHDRVRLKLRGAAARERGAHD